MRVRALLPTLLLFLLLAPPLPAETFRMPEEGITLTVPDGWTHDQKDLFGFVLVPPADQQDHNKIRKIRAHLSSQKGKDLAEQLELSIDSITKNAPKWGTSSDRKHFLGSSEVLAQSGLIGLKGEFGEKQTDGTIRYTVNMYYFKNAAGKTVCVCAYVFGPEDLAKEYEQIILSGIKLSHR